MKHTLPRLIAVCALLLTLCLPAHAQVITTQDATAGQAVYIAGNPDMYPIEYYNAQTQRYEGLLPALYEEIARHTGLTLAYIHAGTQNQQQRLAQNKQADIISAHVQGSVTALGSSFTLVSLPRGEETVQVCIGLTEIASPEVVSAIQGELEKLTDSQLLALSLSVTQPVRTVPLLAILIGLAVLLLLLAGLTALLIHRKKAALRRQQARHTDSLTGIGSSEYFSYCFTHHISAASYSLYYIAYIAFDVQRIETYLGTAPIEEIQRRAANLLASGAADTDFAARMADGVFTLAFQCPSQELAAQYIDTLLSQLNDYQDLKEYKTPFQAGIFHLDAPNVPYEKALFNARQGYNDAVQQKAPYAFCDSASLNRKALQVRLQRKLSDALSGQQFRLYLQFIVDGTTGSICGAEALSRWQNPAEGLLGPGHYIDAMIQAGIIDRLDFYIMEETCRQLEEWQGTPRAGLWLSCNFTRMSISSAHFIQTFTAILERYTFPRHQLVVELTEDSLADNSALAFQNVLACKKTGVRIALDDFGSGYSSFSDLCDYPIDIIKIDKHIIAKAITPRGSALLSGLTRMAHDLNIQVLCEGVETDNENTSVHSTGCDYIQGYYYCRVLPREEAPSFLARHARLA